MTRSIKIDDGIYQKIKKIAKEDRRDLKVVLELAVLNYMNLSYTKKRITEK